MRLSLKIISNKHEQPTATDSALSARPPLVCPQPKLIKTIPTESHRSCSNKSIATDCGRVCGSETERKLFSVKPTLLKLQRKDLCKLELTAVKLRRPVFASFDHRASIKSPRNSAGQRRESAVEPVSQHHTSPDTNRLSSAFSKDSSVKHLLNTAVSPNIVLDFQHLKEAAQPSQSPGKSSILKRSRGNIAREGRDIKVLFSQPQISSGGAMFTTPEAPPLTKRVSFSRNKLVFVFQKKDAEHRTLELEQALHRRAEQRKETTLPSRPVSQMG